MVERVVVYWPVNGREYAVIKRKRVERWWGELLFIITGP